MRYSYKIQNYSVLEEYSTIPVSFMVESIYKVSLMGKGGLGGIKLEEEKVEIPYCKDSDSLPNNRPIDWPKVHDVRNWRFITGWDEDKLVGGVTMTDVAPNGTAVLFDHRVHPSYRNTGKKTPGIGYNIGIVGINWAVTVGCKRLFMQNQNTNVPGCKHLHQYGVNLISINTNPPEPSVPGEVQLTWEGYLKSKNEEPYKMYPIEEDSSPVGWKSDQQSQNTTPGGLKIS